MENLIEVASGTSNLNGLIKQFEFHRATRPNTKDQRDTRILQILKQYLEAPAEAKTRSLKCAIAAIETFNKSRTTSRAKQIVHLFFKTKFIKKTKLGKQIELQLRAKEKTLAIRSGQLSIADLDLAKADCMPIGWMNPENNETEGKSIVSVGEHFVAKLLPKEIAGRAGAVSPKDRQIIKDGLVLLTNGTPLFLPKSYPTSITDESGETLSVFIEEKVCGISSDPNMNIRQYLSDPNKYKQCALSLVRVAKHYELGDLVRFSRKPTTIIESIVARAPLWDNLPLVGGGTVVLIDTDQFVPRLSFKNTRDSIDVIIRFFPHHYNSIIHEAKKQNVPFRERDADEAHAEGLAYYATFEEIENANLGKENISPLPAVSAAPLEEASLKLETELHDEITKPTEALNPRPTSIAMDNFCSLYATSQFSKKVAILKRWQQEGKIRFFYALNSRFTKRITVAL